MEWVDFAAQQTLARPRRRCQAELHLRVQIAILEFEDILRILLAALPKYDQLDRHALLDKPGDLLHVVNGINVDLGKLANQVAHLEPGILGRRGHVHYADFGKGGQVVDVVRWFLFLRFLL